LEKKKYKANAMAIVPTIKKIRLPCFSAEKYFSISDLLNIEIIG
jgi:hypothetical protein